jgi:hypothetical protein
MTEVGARRKYYRGFWRMSWVAVVNGQEIQNVRFRTREEAIAYAMRVRDYQNYNKQGMKDVET